MDNVIDVLKEYKDLINLSHIDRTLELPIGSTSRIVRGELYRSFTAEQEKKIRQVLINMARKILK